MPLLGCPIAISLQFRHLGFALLELLAQRGQLGHLCLQFGGFRFLFLKLGIQGGHLLMQILEVLGLLTGLG